MPLYVEEPGPGNTSRGWNNCESSLPRGVIPAAKCDSKRLCMQDPCILAKVTKVVIFLLLRARVVNNPGIQLSPEQSASSAIKGTLDRQLSNCYPIPPIPLPASRTRTSLSS